MDLRSWLLPLCFLRVCVGQVLLRQESEQPEFLPATRKKGVSKKGEKKPLGVPTRVKKGPKTKQGKPRQLWSPCGVCLKKPEARDL